MARWSPLPQSEKCVLWNRRLRYDHVRKTRTPPQSKDFINPNSDPESRLVRNLRLSHRDNGCGRDRRPGPPAAAGDALGGGQAAAAAHPQLGRLYVDLLGTESNATDRAKRARDLAQIAPNLPESRLLVAETALDAGILGVARDAANKIAVADRDTRAERVAARAAEAEGDWQSAAQAWQRAADARPAPGWLCSSCGTMHRRWEAVCDHCGSFDTVAWRHPAAAAVATGRAPVPAASGATGHPVSSSRPAPSSDAEASAPTDTRPPLDAAAPTPGRPPAAA